MLTGLGCVMVFLILVFLLFWPGFVLQSIFVRSKAILEVLVYSIALGIAYIVLICPVLDLVWDISLVSISCSVLLLSGLLFMKKPDLQVSPPLLWEVIVLVLIFSYGFLLRSYTLVEILPAGQDAWRHLSFMQYIHETHTLPDFIPWMEPPQPVTIYMYPPGAHCIGALLSLPLKELSFPLTELFFIGMGAASSLSSYIVLKNFLGPKAVLSSLYVAVFVPHMIMTTEVTAEAISIFICPLIPYLYYRNKKGAAAILLGSIVLIHHLTALGVVIPLFALALVFTFHTKKLNHIYSGGLISLAALILSSPWWLQRTFHLASPAAEPGFREFQEAFFNPYTTSVSPLLIFFSMVGFYMLLKERKEYSLFLITWGVSLFIASQPLFPLWFSNHRFLAFFIFPCSFMASLGLLTVKNHVKGVLFIFLLIIVFLPGSSPRFWPSTGEENLLANEWIRDSTLDPVFYVYGPHYTFVYSLSHRKILTITDFDDPFTYGGSTYFYDDADWVPHDISRFGQFDKVYSCKGVVIFEIV
ncbi:MAG: hypothetical protein HXS44_13615 [Theionarchaea archaeon]|nr:hypothetical protein [Theionarchaea archaeon]